MVIAHNLLGVKQAFYVFHFYSPYKGICYYMLDVYGANEKLKGDGVYLNHLLYLFPEIDHFVYREVNVPAIEISKN